MVGSSVLAALLSLAAAAEPALTESAFVERVLASGLEARVLDAEAALARAEAVGVGAWPNPRLDWERQPNPTEDRVVGGQHLLVASIPLQLSGRLGLEAQAAERSADAAQARRSRARAQLRREAAEAFSAVLAADLQLALLERSLENLQSLGRVVEARERAGEAAGYERTRIALEVAVVEDERRGAALAQAQARRDAQALLGAGAPPLPAFTGELAPARARTDAAALLERLASRGDLEALRLEAESAGLARRAAERAWVPELELRGGALLLEGAQPGGAAGFVVGAGFPLPIFERGQGPRARAGAREALASAQREQQLRRAQVLLSAAVAELAGRAERRARHREDVLARAEELRTIAAAGYRGGTVDLLGLVDAERAARAAGLGAVTLALEVARAEAALAFLAGDYDAVEGSGR